MTMAQVCVTVAQVCDSGHGSCASLAVKDLVLRHSIKEEGTGQFSSQGNPWT